MANFPEITPGSTLEKIQHSAMAEFLEKGFASASLRQIVKNAGVTTGAFYGYFGSKDELFSFLVEEHAAKIMERFMLAQREFADLPAEEQPSHVGVESGQCVRWFVEYMYEHYDACKLLFCRNEGTKYENFLHEMVTIEMDYTDRYMEVLLRLGQRVEKPSNELCHMIISGMFDGIFEVIRHDMSKERALHYVEQIQRFYNAGWMELVKVQGSF